MEKKKAARQSRVFSYQRPDEHQADQQQHATNQRAHPADRVAEDRRAPGAARENAPAARGLRGKVANAAK
jgi:hypothetical protein